MKYIIHVKLPSKKDTEKIKQEFYSLIKQTFTNKEVVILDEECKTQTFGVPLYVELLNDKCLDELRKMDIVEMIEVEYV